MEKFVEIRIYREPLSKIFFRKCRSFLGSDNCHLVISKLKLGSELETDFVTLTYGYSNENNFQLIEIKQPSAKLFSKKGTI
jgi:hypothetical protein